MNMNIPPWVQDELDEPASEGGRNNQMIRIGPALLRAGNTVDEVFELLHETYPEVSTREVRQVCRSAQRLAGQEDQPATDIDRLHLREITHQAQQVFPEVLRDCSPVQLDPSLADWTPVKQRLSFVGSLFKPDDIIWIGEEWMSGPKWYRHFRSMDDWMGLLARREYMCFGHFTSHCTFQPGTVSRANESVKDRRYWVVESDTLTSGQILKVFNYLSADHDLRAIVNTGGKSVHGWFERSNAVTDQEFGALIKGLQCDPSTLRPSQPVRLPGYTRPETGRPQRLLYLNELCTS